MKCFRVDMLWSDPKTSIAVHDLGGDGSYIPRHYDVDISPLDMDTVAPEMLAMSGPRAIVEILPRM